MTRRRTCRAAHPSAMTAMKAELWVLEFLLDQDALSESVVRELYEHLLVGGAELSKTIQVRLLLRVLREHAANVSDATINALNCLATSHADPPEAYSPFSKPTQLVPPPDLYLQARLARSSSCCYPLQPPATLSGATVLTRRCYAPRRSRRSWCFRACAASPWRACCSPATRWPCWRSTLHPS